MPFVCQAAQTQISLCMPREPIVFSCQIGAKLVSLCRPSEARKELIYKFGTPEQLDLIYPDRSTGGKGTFRVSSAPLVGGGITTITFRRGAYEYGVYSKVGRSAEGTAPEDRVPEFEDGIVISKKGKRLKQLICDDGGAGFRESVDWIGRGSDRP